MMQFGLMSRRDITARRERPSGGKGSCPRALGLLTLPDDVPDDVAVVAARSAEDADLVGRNPMSHCRWAAEEATDGNCLSGTPSDAYRGGI